MTCSTQVMQLPLCLHPNTSYSLSVQLLTPGWMLWTNQCEWTASVFQFGTFQLVSMCLCASDFTILGSYQCLVLSFFPVMRTAFLLLVSVECKWCFCCHKNADVTGGVCELTIKHTWVLIEFFLCSDHRLCARIEFFQAFMSLLQVTAKLKSQDVHMH